MMNDDDLKQIFENAPVPEPDELVQARIKREALAAFRQAQSPAGEEISENSQGNTVDPRLTESSSVINLTERKDQMKNSPLLRRKKPLWLGSLAASIATVIVWVVFKNTPIEERSITHTPFPAVEETEQRLQEVDAAKQRVDNKDSAEKKNEMVMAEQKAKRQPEKMDALASREAIAGYASAAPPASLAISDAEGTLSRWLPAESVVQPEQGINRDRFEHVTESPIKRVSQQPVSTFSIDVDTASYSFVRRQLNRGVLPAEDAVRVEEMVNYFDYAYPAPSTKAEPFATHVQVSPSPWKAGNKLIHIGIKGYDIDKKNQPDSNLVFLLDVSGSMSSPDKLPLVKQSMSLLLESLKPTDKISIVVYAGAAGAVLEPTMVKEKGKILAALEQLQAGGSTAGGQGLDLAYRLAEQNFNPQAVNRIILATDGDFNVGITQDERLEDFVARKRASGIYLSVFGFGEGNYQDALMQTLAQNGNGIAAYIDTLSEAQKIMINEATRALFPIANDVKIQVEFNPTQVAEYRLIGYETRALNQEDFNNDKVDAGDIGAGHTVTAIYEITPVGAASGLMGKSRYDEIKPKNSHDTELGFLKLRYKRPGEKESHLVTTPIVELEGKRELTVVDKKLLEEMNFSISVAGFAQILRGGQYTGEWSYDDVIKLAQANKGDDAYGYRTEFIQLVRKAKVAKAI